MSDPLDALMERLWATHGERVHQRLHRVVVGLDAVGSGEPVDTQALAGDCHVLAGALGTYGRPGSDLLRDTEQALLDGPSAPHAADLARRLRELADRLHR